MTAEQRAFDLGRFQRIVGVEGPRVRGNFTALAVQPDATVHVSPLDVTIYDEHRSGGISLHHGDLSATVRPDGEVEIPDHMIRERVRYDVADVRAEMESAIRLVAEAAQFHWKPREETNE